MTLEDFRHPVENGCHLRKGQIKNLVLSFF
jgi:hypothetical protein